MSSQLSSLPWHKLSSNATHVILSAKFVNIPDYACFINEITAEIYVRLTIRLIGLACFGSDYA